MMLLSRDSIQFPNGDNATDVIINARHFNRTTLDFFNYTLYSNGTLSNESRCYLAFDQFQPFMFSNGTVVNGTSCETPIKPIGVRGSIGIAVGALFSLSIILTLTNLRKHGRRYLAKGKRWRAVGRRWQWYWMIYVAACGMISTFTGIDVDRDYLPGLSIILQSFFLYLMLPGLIACVWEAVRHWGSWQERQIVDADPYGLPQDDRRSRKEFYLPLIFYLFAFLSFFMTVPRAWTPIQMQRSDEQVLHVAIPAATDVRFKAGAVFAGIAWLIIVYDLWHNIYYYSRKVALVSSQKGLFLGVSPKLLIGIGVVGARIGYAIASAFYWSISPLRLGVHPGLLHGLGYGPALIIIIVFNIYGYMDPNEDRELIRRRAKRGRDIDTELGIMNKPTWWSKRGRFPSSAGKSAEQRLKDLTTEIGGGRATAGNVQARFEMDDLKHRQGNTNPFSDSKAASIDEDESGTWFWQRKKEKEQEKVTKYYVRGSSLLEVERPEKDKLVKPSATGSDSPGASNRPGTSSKPRQQTVRSMLDI